MAPHDSELLEKLTRIETLLTTFVGATGNNGRFGDLEAKVDEHQTYIDQQKGAGRFIHYTVTIAVSAVSGFLGRYLK